MAVPLQILAWVVAVLVGGVIVRYLAKATGLVTGDSIIDILTGTGWGRYIRVFALVPFWALATRRPDDGVRRRHALVGRASPHDALRPPGRTPRRGSPAGRNGEASEAARSPRRRRSARRRSDPDCEPAPAPARRSPAPAPAPARLLLPLRRRPENGSTSDVPRPRRIPKRGDVTF